MHDFPVTACHMTLYWIDGSSCRRIVAIAFVCFFVWCFFEEITASPPTPRFW